MNGFKQVMVVILVALLSGCYAPQFSGTYEKPESVAVAAKVVTDVKSLDLRVRPGEQCWVDGSEVRADYVHGKLSAASSARNACGPAQY